MKITIEETDKIKAKRLLVCDNIFSLLWELDSKLRSFQKYEDNKTKEQMIDELREIIHEDNLLDLWQ